MSELVSECVSQRPISCVSGWVSERLSECVIACHNTSANASRGGAATQPGLPSHSNQQHSDENYSMPSSAQTHSAQTDRVMAAAQAAQQVKHACTIDEAELLALRPTLLKGYASLQDNSRSAVAFFNTCTDLWAASVENPLFTLMQKGRFVPVTE